jgi:hypothetical protein
MGNTALLCDGGRNALPVFLTWLLKRVPRTQPEKVAKSKRFVSVLEQLNSAGRLGTDGVHYSCETLSLTMWKFARSARIVIDEAREFVLHGLVTPCSPTVIRRRLLLAARSRLPVRRPTEKVELCLS